MSKPVNLSDNLKRLSEIAEWFDEQETVDVEEGLVKVKEAAQIIKESKSRLKAIENEFNEIKKDIDEDDHTENLPVETTITKEVSIDEDIEDVSPEDIPF